MQPYLVHVERRAVTRWNMITANDAGRAVEIQIESARRVQIDATLDSEDWVGIETVYCRTKAEAELMANKIAMMAPDRMVYICKVEAVSRSGATPPVISNYSEKGLVPR